MESNTDVNSRKGEAKNKKNTGDTNLINTLNDFDTETFIRANPFKTLCSHNKISRKCNIHDNTDKHRMSVSYHKCNSSKCIGKNDSEKCNYQFQIKKCEFDKLNYIYQVIIFNIKIFIF